MRAFIHEGDVSNNSRGSEQMNYSGSYRKLLGNAKAAMIGAIEIYNKPAFQYRDECFVILLLNAWELALKALLSKNGKSIFYPKKRGAPYRTLSLRDALGRTGPLLPKALPELPVRRNIELLSTYRDNAVHFYNQPDFGIVICALAQTSIKNFRDLLSAAFAIQLEDDINWCLLPLGIQPPVDPIAYISRGPAPGRKKSKAVMQFLSELAEAATDVMAAGADNGRLLTVFSVKLESVKKIGESDVVVGLEKATAASGPLAIVRTQDPNITHPLRLKGVVEQIGSLHGKPFTTYVFQAIAWKHKLKGNPQYCWMAQEGVLTRYSNDVVAWVKRLSKVDLTVALSEYRAHLRAKQRARRGKTLGV
jgi:hypothetical protein